MNEQIKKNKSKTFFFLAYRALSYDFFLYFAIDTMYMSQVQGMSFSTISLLVTIYALSYIVFSIPAVKFVRWIGTANASRLGTASLLISIVLAFFAPWSIFVSKVFYAFGLVLKHVAEPKILKDNLKMYGFSEKYGKYNGLSQFIFALVDGITCIAAGFLFTIWPYAPLIICAFLVAVALVMSIFVKNEKEIYKKENGLPPHNTNIEKWEYIKLFKYHTTWLLLLFSMLFFGVMYCGTDILKMTYQDVGFSALTIAISIGIVKIIRSFITLGFSNIYNKLKFNAIYIVISFITVAFLCIGLGGMFLSGWPALIVMIIGSILLYVARDLYDTTRIDFVMNSNHLTKRQSLLSITNIGNYLGRMFMSLALTGILAKLSPAIANLILIGSTILFVITISLLLDRKRKVNKY